MQTTWDGDQRRRHRRRRWRAWIPALALALATTVSHKRAEARTRSIRVPLTIHVATQEGRSVVSETRILASVRRANRELAKFDVYLVVEDIVPSIYAPRLKREKN